MFPPYAHSNATSLRRRSDSTNPDALFDVPADLLAFYDKVGTKGSLDCGDGSGLDKRSGGYKTNGKGADGTRYCGDKAESPTYVWWVSNMDVDCDGAPDGTSGICQGDGSYFGETAFADESGKPIDAMKVQYVVIDQDDDFDPTKFGVQPLSAVAVICGSGGQMTFGVWADTNAIGSMGEASVTLARVCFGDSINGNSGHDEADVLYIAFPGSKDDTVPKGLGSDESALFDMGNKLVSGLFGGDSAGSSSGDGGGSTAGGGEKSSTGAASATSAGGVVDGATKGGGGQATTKAVSTSKPGSSSTSSPSSDSTSTAMPDGSGEGGSQDFLPAGQAQASKETINE
ncbi:hypothetical protein JCM11641_006268 [Rhodosporidiobolus odoratus]